jgi:hypothetical protein
LVVGGGAEYRLLVSVLRWELTDVEWARVDEALRAAVSASRDGDAGRRARALTALALCAPQRVQRSLSPQLGAPARTTPARPTRDLVNKLIHSVAPADDSSPDGRSSGS